MDVDLSENTLVLCEPVAVESAADDINLHANQRGVYLAVGVGLKPHARLECRNLFAQVVQKLPQRARLTGTTERDHRDIQPCHGVYLAARLSAILVERSAFYTVHLILDERQQIRDRFVRNAGEFGEQFSLELFAPLGIPLLDFLVTIEPRLECEANYLLNGRLHIPRGCIRNEA